jgi:hypothetical protein
VALDGTSELGIFSCIIIYPGSVGRRAAWQGDKLNIVIDNKNIPRAHAVAVLC